VMQSCIFIIITPVVSHMILKEHHSFEILEVVIKNRTDPKHLTTYFILFKEALCFFFLP